LTNLKKFDIIVTTDKERRSLKMTEFREKLLDRMIRLYGFENPMVIEFAKMCETYPQGANWDKGLKTLVECHEAMPYVEECEEE
jgi:hypothetical protein